MPARKLLVTVSRIACVVGGTLAGLLVLLVAVSKRQPFTHDILVSVFWGFIAWGIFRLAVWIGKGAKKTAIE
jgi:hypothetical protein